MNECSFEVKSTSIIRSLGLEFILLLAQERSMESKTVDIYHKREMVSPTCIFEFLFLFDGNLL